MKQMTERLRRGAAELRANVNVLVRVVFDAEAPWYVRLLIFLIVAYVVSPVDIIPDFIPVLGLLDEIILVPLALRLALRLLPPALVERYRQTPTGTGIPRYLQAIGVVLVLTLWLALIALAVAALRG